jgi:hypothetical protein
MLVIVDATTDEALGCVNGAGGATKKSATTDSKNRYDKEKYSTSEHVWARASAEQLASIKIRKPYVAPPGWTWWW